jgi:protein-L-isoaspartate O-methyltransferase
MYATVLEALDLKSGKSFLNVGSGSGYLSCLAAFLLGEEGVSHGVEVSDFCCSFSKEKAKLWHAKLLANRQVALRNGEQWAEGSVIAADGISFVNANCFDIDVLSAVNTLKYDRIYVGAGCPDARKEFFLSMLADNGILVVPINEKNQMLSIRKFCGRVYSIRAISNVNFAPLVDTAVRADEPEMLGELLAHEAKTLSGDIEACVRKVQAVPSSASFIIHPLAAPIVAHASSSSASSSPTSSSSSAAAAASDPHVTFSPVQRVRLPPLGKSACAGRAASTCASHSFPCIVIPSVWAPTRKRHMQFPPEFRSAVLTILLANNRFQGSPCAGHFLCAGSPKACRQHNCRCTRDGVGFLPHQLWLHVFSFANRLDGLRCAPLLLPCS